MSTYTRKSKIKGLILTLKEGDVIAISNGELMIEAVEIKGHRVRIAFKATRDIPITRLLTEKDGTMM